MRILTLSILVVLIGCVTYDPVIVVIEEVIPDVSAWKCYSRWQTRMRTTDGRIFIKCNKWGMPDDTLHGHIVHGSLATPSVVFGRKPLNTEQ